MVFKLPFHKRGVSRQDIANAYRKSGLAALQPDRRFIVAQTRPFNLRDRLCSTALSVIPGQDPSNYLKQCIIYMCSPLQIRNLDSIDNA